MKLSLFHISNSLRYVISLLAFTGLIACKETDGFNAADFGTGSLNSGQTVRLLTEPSIEQFDALENSVRELESIEVDISERHQNILRLQADILDLKHSVAANSKAINNADVSFTNIERLEEEKSRNASELADSEAVLLEHEAGKEEKEIELMQKFTEVVGQMSEYKSNDRLKVLKDEVLDRFEIFKAEKTFLNEQIVEAQKSNDDIQMDLVRLEGIDSDADVAKRVELSENLVLSEQRINALSARVITLEKLIGANCALEPQICVNPEGASSNMTAEEDFDLEDLGLEQNSDSFFRAEELRTLDRQKVALKDIIAQLDLDLLTLDTQITLARTSTRDQDSLNERLISQLNNRKTELNLDKSAALKEIGDIDTKILENSSN